MSDEPDRREPGARESTDSAAPARAEAPWEVPEEPPAEVLEALGTAQRVLAELEARGLRFGVSERDGQIRVEVVTSGGGVVRQLSTRHAVEILSGARLPELGFEAVG